MEELEQNKTEAEIAYLRAQAAKLDADRALARPRLGGSITELVKIIGALIIGAGGVVAAFTGYQLTEVKKERMQLEIDGLERKVKEQNEQLLEGTRRKTDLDTAVSTAQQQLEAAQTQLTTAQSQFAKTKSDLEEVSKQLTDAKKTAVATSSSTTSLDAAIERTKKIQADVKSADSELKTALSRIESADLGVRTQAVNSLAFQYGSSSEAKSAILAMLQPEKINQLSPQGMINCLVILARHKPESWNAEQVKEAEAMTKRLRSRQLNQAEQWALGELEKALQRTHLP